MAALLEMRDVCKAFNGVPALAAARLAIAPGEVHGLIGQNGAGKSTLIKVLTGVYARDAGELTFAGAPAEYANPRIAQDHGIATIYQELNLVPLRSVAENICLGNEPKRWGMLDTAAMRTRAREVLALFGIDVDVDLPLGGFSAGIRQLVAIARAVTLNAKLVIMDEPTSSLDAREAEFLFKVIGELKRNDVAVLYVTHFLDELYRHCDNVTVMRDGGWVCTRPVAGSDKTELIAHMLGRDVEEVRKAGMTDFSMAKADRQVGERLLAVTGLAAGNKVRDVSFTVNAGEVVALAGLLGAGRTETVRAIFAADRKDAGSISLATTNSEPANPREAIKARLGFLTEDRKSDGIVPEMSVRQNITLAHLPALTSFGQIDRKREKALVDKYVAELGIKLADIEQPISQLSGGNQQKALLAKWFATDPHVLLMDEPTRGIDVGAKREIHHLILDIVSQGKAVVMISSEFEELAEGADRIIVMHEGRSLREMHNPGITEDAIINAVAKVHAA